MRYYYTDPLAAAYMAKHFGMKFMGEYTEIGAQTDSRELFRTVGFVMQYTIIGGLDIHPESLHLLKPQDGDAVEFDRWFWDRQRHEDLKDVLPQPHFALVKIDGDWKQIFSAGIGWDRARLDEPFGLPLKVIQRGGKPFFWPESEP